MSDLPPVKIPRVARVNARTKVAPLALGLLVLGTGVFASLASSRAAREEQATALPPLRAPAITPPAPPPPELAPVAPVAAPVAVQLAPTPMPMPFTTALPAPRPLPATVLRRSDDGAAERARARVAAPTLIVDLAQVRSGDGLRLTPAALSDSGAPVPAPIVPTVALPDPTAAAIAAAGPPPEAVAAGAAAGATAAVLGGSADPGARDLNGNERFATRAGNRETEVARAQRLPNQNTLVAQGTIIGAVMETALDSDLPGFARAIVSRDVLSFDGSQVMIPAGSHVIGEYNSGVAQGASRIFIVWNRLIRPDGVSIALASPAVDDLGRGGLGGKVNRHFLQRYGGAILLSVLTGGIGVLTQSVANGNTVVVSSSNEATSLAGQASRGTDIAPTIKTPQGANVRIFVARDLDFTGVGAAS